MNKEVQKAIEIFENEIEEYKKAITYLKTKYDTKTTSEKTSSRQEK